MFKVILRDLTCLIWVGFSNESCSVVRVGTCGDFICHYCYCGINVMMMLSSIIAAVLYEVLHVLSVVGLVCRTVILIVWFTCMVALVLNFACDQMVFLRIVLSLVA
jgi:hypothetical protein